MVKGKEVKPKFARELGRIYTAITGGKRIITSNNIMPEHHRFLGIPQNFYNTYIYIYTYTR